jgi:hypothetical protein
VEAGSALYTDALNSYRGLDEFEHGVVDHAVQYVDGKIHTNGLENFWSLLKRGINGTYVSVEPFHLFRYLDEQTFRYNNRKEMDDFDRFRLAMSQIVGKRLTWDQLTESNLNRKRALTDKEREVERGPPALLPPLPKNRASSALRRNCHCSRS